MSDFGVAASLVVQPQPLVLGNRTTMKLLHMWSIHTSTPNARENKKMSNAADEKGHCAKLIRTKWARNQEVAISCQFHSRHPCMGRWEQGYMEVNILYTVKTGMQSRSNK